MRQALKIHHDLGDVVVKPASKVNATRLKKLICSTLDQYLDEERVPAMIVHAETKQRYGKDYRTPGYYLRLYRLRSDLTQAELADQASMRQHHLSEMEHNKRPIGKAAAQKLADVLKCDYHKLLIARHTVNWPHVRLFALPSKERYDRRERRSSEPA
jgi:transcriptional regulator with XRE-family HTH domain